ncbi:hypothetical protein LJR009_002313 [Bosea sp. LjRoot9]|uniref:ORC-CDC6 family AAA ATPase n=1 Tax=Bosea sp. LjRoot9 TaxID=3342341 RepID=UPI003ECED316
MQGTRKGNPFGITKAVDLNDEQIENLWVKISAADDSTVTELDHPASPMPTYILGAKGSGKTHLMRHQAFDLQRLRYKEAGLSVGEGVMADGYIGLYVRCSGLHSNRFTGKRQSEELWQQLFAFYFELWLAQHVISLAMAIQHDAPEADEKGVCDGIVALLDKQPSGPIDSFQELREHLSKAQRTLDYEINNCLITGRLDIDIITSPGNLIFGIPKVLASNFEFLRDVLFVYSIDEFENLTKDQQIHVNTLYREREPPSTFRIGSRSYGVHTFETNSAGEENIQDSEYSVIRLDATFRELTEQYASFCRTLIYKRLEDRYGKGTFDVGSLGKHFEDFDPAWNSASWATIAQTPSPDRDHFRKLRDVISKLPPVVTYDDAQIALQVPSSPLLEKLNILLFYQDLANGRPLKDALIEIERLCADFTLGNSTRYKQAYNHYSRDLVAQLLRENRTPQTYGGLRTFIRMSAGIPRALLTILRSIYEWSVFSDEKPFEGGEISIRSQHKGVIDASDWYYSNMRKAGEEGLLLQQAIERLANLFRIHRFGDKPIESSLSSFSIPERGITPGARHILQLAEARAFIHRLPGTQKERNSEDITSKFQISPMLAPRWDLPMIRRGVAPLSPDAFNAIFDPAMNREYTTLESEWRQRVSAGIRNDSAIGVKHQQIGLFDV